MAYEPGCNEHETINDCYIAGCDNFDAFMKEEIELLYPREDRDVNP